MQFKLQDDKEYTYPATLSAITLGQRVAFYHQYGKELDAQAVEINKLPEGMEKEMALSDWHLDMATASFAHYTGMPLETVREEITIESIMMVYNIDMTMLAEEERTLVVEPSYMWNNEEWVIAAPELLPTSDMRLDEFICAKEITRQIYAAGQSNWEALPYLCSVYLRKKDEAFDESMIAAGSERMKLMNDLPLNIALGVGFFLSITLSIYKTTLPFSGQGELKASAQPDTSTGGVG